jgi:LacI family transcriptional regulator
MKQVLLWLPFEQSFGRELFQGVAEFMQLHEPWKLTVPGERGWPQQLDLCTWQGDGIIYPLQSTEREAHLRSRGTPFVNITAWPGVPTVRNDNKSMGHLGAEYFMNQGYRHFAFYGTPRTLYAHQRWLGFSEALAEQRLEARCFGVNPDPSTPSPTYDEIKDWLRSLPLPLALQLGSDDRALPIYQAAAELGLGIPDQIAVMGMDNELMGLCLHPSLSTVQSDGFRVGFEAAHLLQRQFQGETVSNDPVLIPPRGILARKSTAAFGYDDAEVVQALIYIRENGRKGLLVDRVAAQVGLSRRNLERRFLKAVGHTLWREMRRVQIEHVKNLLRGTPWPIKRVALDSAFPNPARLAQIFSAETGETPVQYRRRHRGGT